MLLMSRRLTDYHIIPAGAIVRINLAWESSLDELKKHLDELTHYIFLDIPSGRKKPPNNTHRLEDILNIIETYNNIRYLGISQTENNEHLMPWIIQTPTRINVVPKIESMEGINNIKEICSVLREPKTIMLDHDDLFQDLCNSYDHPENMYEDWINPLIEVCNKMQVRVLRTAGIVFIDR